MEPTGPIVCATDLSPGGARAVDLAARCAHDLGAGLRIVHATDTGGGGASSASIGVAATEAYRALQGRIARRTEQLRALLESERERARAIAGSAEVSCALIEGGRPWEAVVADARREGARLLVVGPHGQSGPAEVLRAAALEWLLGITADRVVRHAPCPVLVAPNVGELPSPFAPPAAGEIPAPWVIGVDFEPPSHDALALALRLSSGRRARIVAVHTLPSPSPLPTMQRSTPIGEEAEPLYDAELEEGSALARLHGTIEQVRAAIPGAAPVESRIERGDPAVAIGDVASDLGATMIVIGTHGRSGIAHALLGSVAERVLRRARQPVLCVRPGA